MVCIALGVDDYFGGGPCPPLYILGDRITWKVLAEYNWSPTTTQSCSFLCTTASSTLMRVVTEDVRYIHELSLTLEYSMPISSPAALGLTGFGWCYKRLNGVALNCLWVYPRLLYIDLELWDTSIAG